MKLKKLSTIFTALVLAGGLALSVVPSQAHAYGGSRSFSSSSFSRSSFSSSRSSFGSSSRSSFGSSSRSSYSRPSSFSRSSTSKSSSFSGRTSTRGSFGSTTRRSSFSGNKKGSFSGATSTRTSRPIVRGRTYSSRYVSHGYYGGRYVSINHYYSVGYSPFGWYGYYDGFTTGMFMSSLYQPWGGVYYTGGHYTQYGASPIAWIIDFILLIIVLFLIIWACVAFSPNRKVYRRKL